MGIIVPLSEMWWAV